MSCDDFCETFDDVGVCRVKRAILCEAQRGIGHEEDALYLVMNIRFSEVEEHNNI